MAKYVMALDSGTTSNRCILFNEKGEMCSVAQKEFTQHFPKPGWVEHEPGEIWSTQLAVAREAMTKIGASAEDIAAIGITNQRETTIVWDKNTGKPVYNAIVWQCRRTGELCEDIKKTEFGGYIRENTGLVVDAYFSATKIKWILDNVNGAREKAEAGELLFGTVDTWLLWRLTKGKVHATDETNASRTMLYNIKTHEWDDALLSAFDIPKCMMPKVLASGQFYGNAVVENYEGPVTGIAGDQQASLFGQGCFDGGGVKNTYGTGCFLLMNIGDSFRLSETGLLTTAAANFEGEHSYAFEGSVFTGGAVIQWLRDEMGLISSASESEEAALSVKDTGGVYLVPAFTGLGAPYWDSSARGTVTGITRGTNRNHIIRAALESIAYQSAEVIFALIRDSGLKPDRLKADGGASSNNFLMQFQADITGIEIVRPEITESTALGAACLAGITAGFYSSKNEIGEFAKADRIFTPNMSEKEAEKRLSDWRNAAKRACGRFS